MKGFEEAPRMLFRGKLPVKSRKEWVKHPISRPLLLTADNFLQYIKRNRPVRRTSADEEGKSVPVPAGLPLKLRSCSVWAEGMRGGTG
jgi:hypothetical protein